MRRIVLLAFFLLLSCFLLSSRVKAAENATGSSSIQVNYDLPYPGLLPDNPLYLLKAFRDKIISFLIASPVKKAEFNLLNADKRLVAGSALIDKNKVELGVTTISKSNNYLHDSISNLEQAKQSGNEVSSLSTKIQLATLKHEEIIKALQKKVDSPHKSGIDTEYKRILELKKRIEILNKKTK